MRRRSTVLAVAAITLAALVGLTGPARSGHCGPVFMFSGVKVDPVRSPAPNPGAGACVMNDEHVNTNLFVPGANFVYVGTTMTPVGATGTLVIDDREPITLTFTYSATQLRWNSQDVPLEGGTVATATVTSVTGAVVSVTYRAHPEV